MLKGVSLKHTTIHWFLYNTVSTMPERWGVREAREMRGERGL